IQQRPLFNINVHSIFAMSLAHSFLSDPHGMIFIHASCDQPLMNSPITKLSFVILSNAKNLYEAFWRCFDFAQHDKEIGITFVLLSK
ncbi:MAG: hypothetical protein J6U89_02850, partial [Bacteroidaceae bacterium]|nr:hypothetical protein [Bacteroidaceae bacterium]